MDAGAEAARRSGGALRGAAEGAGELRWKPRFSGARRDRSAPRGTGAAPIRTVIGQPPLIRERIHPAPPPVPLREAVSPAARVGGGRRCCSTRRRRRPRLADQADPRPDAVEPAAAHLHRLGPRRDVPAQGHRIVPVVVPDGRRRAARGDGSPQRALPPHPRPVGGLLRAANDRPADVANQQRRRPGAAGGLGDGRRPRARVARARLLHGADALLRRVADDLLPDQRADHRLSAGAARPARPAHDASQPGGARKLSHISAEAFTGHRIVKAFGTEAAEAAKFVARGDTSVPHQHEGDGGACRPAAADGAARRLRDGRRAVVRQPGDRRGRADASASSCRSSPRCS